MTKQTRTLATYGQYSAVEERNRYLGRADRVLYHLAHRGQPVFHSPQPQPVLGVLVGLITEDLR